MEQQSQTQCEVQPQSQAIYDICLTVSSIHNIVHEYTPQFNLEIYFEVAGHEDYPLPYQILQNKKSWNSTTTMDSYRVDNIQLARGQARVIDEMCLFRGSMPIDWMETKQLCCLVEISLGENILGVLRYKFESTLNLDSFVPIFSPSLGIYVEAKLETQLLGIRLHKACKWDATPVLYKAVDYIIEETNRLRSKLKLDEGQNQLMTESKASQSEPEKKSEKDPENLRESTEQSTINSQFYTQYSRIKNVKHPRLFKGKSVEEHRQHLIDFVRKSVYNNGHFLQLHWLKYSAFELAFIQNHMQVARNNFVADFAREVRNKVMRNKGLERNYDCPLMVGKFKIELRGFKLTNTTSTTLSSSTVRPEPAELETEEASQHVVVLVHGFGANSLTMSYIERTLHYLYPHVEILNSKSNEAERDDSNPDLESMGRNLAMELVHFMQKFNDPDSVEISFIGYSLGGLVVRAALVHLEVFRFNMNSYISLSAPHLGHFVHSNKLAKVGMLALSALYQSNIIDNLLMRETADPRHSYLYSLSMHSGLGWFKSVSMYGSRDDGYVCVNSSLAYTREHNQDLTSDIIEEMTGFIDEVLRNVEVSKFEIEFEPDTTKTDLEEFFVGRTSHIAFSNHQAFINCFLLQHYKYFNGENQYLASSGKF